MTGTTIAVLGLGSIGLRHARNVKVLGGTVLGVDPCPEAHRRFESETGFTAVSRNTALEMADVVVIATPNADHLNDLGEAVSAGKPVLVEKPLGHDAVLAQTLIEQAAAAGVPVAAAHNLRFRTVVRRIRELLAEAAIGRRAWARFSCASWLPDWRPGTDYRKNYAADPVTGGVIFDSIHELDLALHLLGPAWLRGCSAGRTGFLDMPSEDVADILLEHESGCRSHIHLDYVTRPRHREACLAGSKGVLEADLRSGSLILRNVDGDAVLAECHPFDPNAEYLAEMKDFIRSASEGSPPACPAREALAGLKLACGARRLAGLPLVERPVRETALR